MSEETKVFHMDVHHASSAKPWHGLHIVRVESGSDGKFYAISSIFGCGKDCGTIRGAVIGLLRDHNCSLVGLRPISDNLDELEADHADKIRGMAY